MSRALEVLLPLPLPPFSFLPPHKQTLPCLGSRVVIPWQQGVRIGIVLGYRDLRAGEGLELREVIAALDTTPFVTDAARTTLRRVARHTLTPEGLVLADLLAVGLNIGLEHYVRPLAALEGLEPDTWTPAADLDPPTLDLYRRQGLIDERIYPAVPEHRVLTAARPVDDALRGKPQHKQRHTLEVLLEHQPVASAAELARLADVSASVASALIRKGYARYESVAAPPPELPPLSPEPTSPEPLPNVTLPLPADLPELSLAGGRRRERLAALKPLLEQDLAEGRNVLVLAPEQSLVDEAARAFADLPVLRLSGELNDAQRLRVWLELQQSPPHILVGSYLALLAPLNPLGRVVVLEEGSSSYKLLSGCRVVVPTAARFLAEASGARLLLSDAVPSPETAWRLPAEARWRLPPRPLRLHVVDLSKRQHNWPLSPDLIKVLKQVESRRRQAILLAPRRGFSAALRCGDCGWTAQCPNCALSLRYHRPRYLLRCHQCGHSQPAPPLCPTCRSDQLGPAQAAGTQWIVQQVATLLPDLPVYHFDSDHQDDLTDLYRGQPGVVVGTTALFRRPPLPTVSLVTLTLLDTVLNVGDFRAEETALRLLANIGELAPHGRPLVIVQTFRGEHDLLEHARHDEHDAFLKSLLSRRQRFGYPPYSRLARVQLSAKQAPAAEQAATWLAGALRTHGATDDELLGPAPAPVSRLKGYYSYHLLVKADDDERLRFLLEPTQTYRGAAKLRLDVDPHDLASLLD
ncbi:MAG: primosomal protein N' [Trueperaceae bacterium]|nr:primosomal protein N' [Trueperaceae bacterium]